MNKQCILNKNKVIRNIVKILNILTGFFFSYTVKYKTIYTVIKICNHS